MSTWLDVMPAIPLARGVPVIDIHTEPLWRGVVVGREADEWMVTCASYDIALNGAEYGDRDADDYLRPDLDDPQGFAYALNRLTMQAAAAGVLLNTLLDREHCLMELLGRWVQGKTTDADRLALAQAFVTPATP